MTRFHQILSRARQDACVSLMADMAGIVRNGVRRAVPTAIGGLIALTAIWMFAQPFAVRAQLAQGAAAPAFSAPAALAGQPYEFDLRQALDKGPAVVYFYPKAFTSGCTIEAQMFAQSMDEFNRLEATVVGVSGDDIQTLKKFSEGPCGGKFAVAADNDRSIMAAYDASRRIQSGMADRISYVIAPDATILAVFDGISPVEHVNRSLQALQAWHTQQNK
ncbi:peroxiredoxin [Orrella marina]|nr:peroxiredoxin [Orrella marina]